RLHSLPLASLHGLEAGVRVSDEAEHDTIELHRRDRELRVLDDRDLRALLPALELPGTAGDGDRVLPQLVRVLASRVLGRPDAAVQEGHPVGVHLLEGDDARLALAVDRLDVLVAGAARGVVRGVDPDLPRRTPVGAGDGRTVRPNRLRAERELRRERVALDELGRAREEPRHPLCAVVVDLAALE